MDNDATSSVEQQQQRIRNNDQQPITTHTPPPSAAVQSLDTVRALHSTVVSLRSALEEAHREIDQLRRQIGVGQVCANGRAFRSRSQPQLPSQSPRASEPRKPTLRRQSNQNEAAATGPNRSQSQQGTYTIHVQSDDTPRRSSAKTTSCKVVGGRKPTTSRIGLQIKVSSNVKVHRRNTAEMDSTESDSHADTDPSDGDVAAAAPTHQAAKATHQPLPTATEDPATDDVFEDPALTAEKTAALSQQHQQPSEEVDDIELIFSEPQHGDGDHDHDDEDEDLVSIGGDYEPWTKSGQSGTPVLTNYGSIGSDSEGRRTGGGEASMARDDSYDSFCPVTNSSSFLAGPGLRWTNQNVLIETDLSRCGIADEDSDRGDAAADADDDDDGADDARNVARTRHDLSRRNTCPNPSAIAGAYRPLLHREAMAAIDRQQHQQQRGGSSSATGRTPLAVKFSARNSRGPSAHGHYGLPPPLTFVIPAGDDPGEPKRSAGAQTDISAVPEHWRSDSHLMVGGEAGGPGSAGGAGAGGDSGGGTGGGDGGLYTLPSKFVPLTPTTRYQIKVSSQTNEARRILLSDINFTSMVPELSRSADHLCQQQQQLAENTDPNTVTTTDADATNYFKGVNQLQAPDFTATPQPTKLRQTAAVGGSRTPTKSDHVNVSTPSTNAATQPPQPVARNESLDSTRSYAKSSAALQKLSARSRSVSSVADRCSALCRAGQQLAQQAQYSHHRLYHQHQHHVHFVPHAHAHHHYHQQHPSSSIYRGCGGVVHQPNQHPPIMRGMRGSESLHQTPRVTFDPVPTGLAPDKRGANASGVVRASLPDLRPATGDVCVCSGATSAHHREHMLRSCGSSGSTDSLMDETDDWMLRSAGDGGVVKSSTSGGGWMAEGGATATGSRRFSENDVKRDYTPSRQALPFLPKTAKCLRLGHLVKAITTRTGRVVVGRVRYVGPLAGANYADSETFVGLQLPSKVGDCDGSVDGRRFFECAPQHGIFVPFKKIIMAWSA